MEEGGPQSPWKPTSMGLILVPIIKRVNISCTLSHEYRVVKNLYLRLLFTSENRLCANLRVQEKSTNMTSQINCGDVTMLKPEPSHTVSILGSWSLQFEKSWRSRCSIVLASWKSVWSGKDRQWLGSQYDSFKLYNIVVLVMTTATICHQIGQSITRPCAWSGKSLTCHAPRVGSRGQRVGSRINFAMATSLIRTKFTASNLKCISRSMFYMLLLSIWMCLLTEDDDTLFTRAQAATVANLCTNQNSVLDLFLKLPLICL